jgi:hypothetical protein
MSLLHLFLTQSAQSSHDRQQAARAAADRSAMRSVGAKNADLESDIGTLSMVCISLVATLIKKGIITEAEFQEMMASVDEMDARTDQSLDPNTMRKALGLPTLRRKGLPGKRPSIAKPQV